MAPQAHGRPRRRLSRGGEALSPFGLDPRRTFDVGRDGAARDGVQGPPEFLSSRHRLVLGLFLLAVALVGGFAGLAAAAYASGARGAAAIFALLTVLAAPLLALGPAQDWWRFRRGRRVGGGYPRSPHSLS